MTTHDLSGGVESRHAVGNREDSRPGPRIGQAMNNPEDARASHDSPSGSSAPPAQNCGHVPDTEERKAQDRYEDAKHDADVDRRLEAQEQ